MEVLPQEQRKKKITLDQAVTEISRLQKVIVTERESIKEEIGERDAELKQTQQKTRQIDRFCRLPSGILAA